MQRQLKLLLTVFLLTIIGQAKAQQKAEFVEYSNLPDRVMESLQLAQAQKPFATQEHQRELSSHALDSEGLGLNQLPKPSKKVLDATALVKSVEVSTLMIGKYKRGFGAYPDFILVGATAFVVSEDGLCVSNYHVMEPMINQGQGIHPQDSLFFVADNTGKAYEIEQVLTFSKSADLAVFKIDTRGAKLQAFALGNDALIGQRVHTLTHPEAMPYYYSTGVVARNVAYDGNPWENRTEITADFGIGSSGGPIFDDCGNLVAVVSSTQGIYATNNEGRDLQMVVKMTIPVSSLKRLLE